jgi:Cys-tRNA(Pro) deacylase
MTELESEGIARLRAQKVEFTIHQFDYLEGGGTPRSSEILGVAEHAVIKTLVFETKERGPIIVLMHGDRNVDTRALASELQMSKIWSCAPAMAEAFSGWPVGATNPFVLKIDMPIFIEASVLKLPRMYINGGGRGFLVAMDPREFIRVICPQLVHCAKEKRVLGSK